MLLKICHILSCQLVVKVLTVSIDELEGGLVVLGVLQYHLLGHEAIADGRRHVEFDLDVEVLGVGGEVDGQSGLDLDNATHVQLVSLLDHAHEVVADLAEVGEVHVVHGERGDVHDVRRLA